MIHRRLGVALLGIVGLWGAISCSSGKDSTAPGGTIALGVDSVGFLNGTPVSQNVGIVTTGSHGAISLGSPVYSGTTGWLTATVIGTAPSDSISLTVSTAALPAGTQTATIAVSAADETGAPQQLTVTLTLTTSTPAKLSIVKQPAGAVSGSPLIVQPVVEVVDVNGVVVPTATGSVTASVSAGSAILSGTARATLINGVATFTELTLTGSGSSTLQFTSPNVAGVNAPPVGLVVQGGTTVSFGVGQVVLAPGGTQAILPTASTAGVPVGNPSFTFQTRSSAVATVSGAGVITGVAAGQAVIVATLSGVTGAADSLLAVVTAPGAPLLISSLSGFSIARDSTVVVSVYVDMTPTTKHLASGTIAVTWNPVQFAYLGNAAGGAGSGVTVAADSVGGVAQVSFANSTGYTGKVELIRLTFKAAPVSLSGSFALSALDLTTTDFTDLTVGLVKVLQPFVVR